MWQPIEKKPAEGTVAVLYSAGRTYIDGATKEDVVPVLSQPRDYGTMCDIGAFLDGRWIDAYTGHDIFERWNEPEQNPTHWMPLPEPPQSG